MLKNDVKTKNYYNENILISFGLRIVEIIIFTIGITVKKADKYNSEAYFTAYY